MTNRLRDKWVQAQTKADTLTHKTNCTITDGIRRPAKLETTDALLQGIARWGSREGGGRGGESCG